jgi:transposase InsO family protein
MTAARVEQTMLMQKDLFAATTLEEAKERIALLRPESARLWGKMSAAQMLAHCSATMEMAVGMTLPPRRFVGRILGPIVKKAILTEGEPFRRNSPSDKSLIIHGDRDFETERERLYGLLDRFQAGGAERCTRHPHSFFGALTPTEWASFMYIHLDHHLQQFGV